MSNSRKLGAQLAIFQPYGPRNSRSPKTRDDFERVVAWLECAFGTDTIERIWYKENVSYKLPLIQVRYRELEGVSKITIYSRLNILLSS